MCVIVRRNEVLCHLKHEDKDRHSYFTQLEHLARQMRELPLPTDSVYIQSINVIDLELLRVDTIRSLSFLPLFLLLLANTRIRTGADTARVGNTTDAGSDA